MSRKRKFFNFYLMQHRFNGESTGIITALLALRLATKTSLLALICSLHILIPQTHLFHFPFGSPFYSPRSPANTPNTSILHLDWVGLQGVATSPPHYSDAQYHYNIATNKLYCGTFHFNLLGYHTTHSLNISEF